MGGAFGLFALRCHRFVVKAELFVGLKASCCKTLKQAFRCTLGQKVRIPSDDVSKTMYQLSASPPKVHEGDHLHRSPGALHDSRS